MNATSRYQRHLISGDEIRLIEIQPGQRNDPLKAMIRYRQLCDNPLYKALSYTWGSPFNTDHPSWNRHQGPSRNHDLHLDDGPVKITESLHSALIKVRKVNKALILWVDAICIDQSHNEEKSWQIQKMREIYEKASRVLIWLGPSDDTSDLAMLVLECGYRYYLRTSPLKKLGDKRVDAPPPRDIQEFHDQLIAASLGKLFGMAIKSTDPIPDYPIQAVANLLNRAYWGRGWCWQEFTVATKISIICGEKILKDGDMCIQVFLETWDRLKNDLGRQPHGLDHRPWSMVELRRSYRNIEHLRKTGFVDDPSITIPDAWMVYKIWGHMNPNMTDMAKAWLLREAISKLSLKELLQESSKSWLEVNNDHKEDQIFALIGMATDAVQLGITINCAIPWENVYTQVAVAYRKRGDLWFLNHCQGQLPDRPLNLPSWVPDWSQGYRGSALFHHYSPRANHLGTIEGISQPDLEEIEKHARLRLRGVFVDEVAWVSTERFALSVNALATSLRKKLYQWIRRVVLQCRPHTCREMWTVMIANSTDLPLPENYKQATNEEMRQLLDKAFMSILEHDEARDQQLQSIIECFLLCLMQATAWRCVFRTREGRLGLAHAGIQEDDRVVAFMGTETTFILRPVALTSETPRYRIICESFVHGVMEDEGLKASAVVEYIILE